MALLCFGIFAPFVSAVTTVSFNPVGLSPDNLQLYAANGTYLGLYNTSSSNVQLQDGQAYSILVVPANDNLLGNHPDTWFGSFLNKLQQNAIPIIIIAFCVFIAFAALSRRR